MAKFLNSEGLARLVALIKQALGGKQDTLEAVTTSEIDEIMSPTTDTNSFNYTLGANLS